MKIYVLKVEDWERQAFERLQGKDQNVISGKSCTTNCLAPVAKVLHHSFGVAFIMFTTIHAYTSSQSLMDMPTRHRRRGRSAALSIIATTTGAAQAAEKDLPQFKDFRCVISR